jgi:hypothetical protein
MASVNLLSFTERFWLSLGAHQHNWSFPQTSREKDMKAAYAEHGFDSHQQCPDCGGTRFFSMKTMKAGPIFTRSVKQHG